MSVINSLRSNKISSLVNDNMSGKAAATSALHVYHLVSFLISARVIGALIETTRRSVQDLRNSLLQAM